MRAGLSLSASASTQPWTDCLSIFKLFLSIVILSHWIGCINFMACRLAGFPRRVVEEGEPETSTTIVASVE